MGTEIERKFLLASDDWRASIARSTPILQGYLLAEEGRSVRVRRAGERGWLTIKTGREGITRAEFEYEIPTEDAQELLALCEARLEKIRHFVEIEGHTFEIDEFHGENEGLIVAELELTAEDAPFPRPPWLGIEVSTDPRYFNGALARRPYKSWQTATPHRTP